MLDGSEDCHNCGETQATVLCRGCGKPLCSLCVKLEDYGFGCDGCKIVTFCPDCFWDPEVNSVLDREEP